jgi:hypothetical protein
MQHTTLGALDVSRISLGAMGMSTAYTGGCALDDAEFIRTVHQGATGPGALAPGSRRFPRGRPEPLLIPRGALPATSAGVPLDLRSEVAGEDHVLREVAQLAVLALGRSRQLLERLQLAKASTAHQDAHGHADTASARESRLQVGRLCTRGRRFLARLLQLSDRLHKARLDRRLEVVGHD